MPVTSNNSNATTLTVVLTLISCGLALYLRAAYQRRLPFPPGPKKHILWGNLFDMPSDHAYITFRKLSQKFGPVMRLSVPGKSIIILDKLKAAQDLLDQRSIIYSDRPALTMLRDVVGWNWSIVMLNYGEQFKTYRKVLHRGINADSTQYASIQENESRRLLRNLVRNPANFMSYSERWARSMISRITYDYDPKFENDPYIRLAGQCEEIIARTGRPGAYLVDVFPILKYVPKWLPFAGFRREAEAWSLLVQELLESPYRYTTKKMAEGSAKQSYVSILLNDFAENMNPEVERAIKETAAIVHIAGANSIYATLQAFILAMTLYPKAQRKAQAEIDSVTGSERLPILSDRPRMPYIDCLVSEMLRWSRSVPLGIAHELKENDVYNGMLIPGKSVVMANSWSMTRDESLYENPEEFYPERFQQAGLQDPRGIIFGFGRRVCPGKEFANNALFVAIASILSVLQITKAINEKGEEICPTVEYSPGFVCNPKPFRCAITLRSERAGELVEEALAE